jgi:hypothetical protein
MAKNINSNGFDYVDLGLPNGTLWATQNVGASKPSDYGLYFQWGDSKGYTKEQLGKDKMFTWADYKWSIDGSDSNFSKYTKEGSALDLADDAANANMGGDWHLPTDDQTIELIENTTSTWSTQDGVNGRLFISKKDTSKSIFIPAAGGAWDGSLFGRGSFGGVWFSMLDASHVNGGQSLYFYSDDEGLGNYYRFVGLSVRGVIG